ncbi:cwf21 domain-containing protein [Trichoderma novae-zelandiae]
MSDNVGLSTPRGSGTSGYVQRNLAQVRPRDYAAPYPKDRDMRHRQRQPDKAILEHDRKREIEVKVFELRDQLEEEEVEEEEIDRRCDELRKKLLAEMNSKNKNNAPRRAFKEHQVHEMADAKIKESERLRRALKISSDYEEGGHWKKQEERLRESLVKDEGDESKE